MSNCIDFVRIIKQASLEAVENSKPVGILFGTVKTIVPLTVFISQKIILEADELILTRNVTDFETDMSVNHFTENTDGGIDIAKFESHNHAYKGRKSFTIHNSLKEGEKVLLLRVQGGQRFIIVDRIVNHDS